MTRSLFLLKICLAIALISVGLLVHKNIEVKRWEGRLAEDTKSLIREFGLTDIALWTEARYTRNPALADYFTPFQDFPASLEHFPAGSIIAPNYPNVRTSLRIQHSTTKSTQ